MSNLKVPDSRDPLSLAFAECNLYSNMRKGSSCIRESNNFRDSSNILRMTWKIVVLGDGEVGKTSLIKQLLENSFTESYNPTVEDIYLHNFDLSNGSTQLVEILDTAGQYQFPAMRDLSIREGTAFILVFDLSNENSLKYLLGLFEKIKEIKIKLGKSDKVPLVLVGNKSDLIAFDNYEKKIIDDATSIAHGIFKCSFIEISAKCSDRKEISKIFTSIAEQILNKEIEDQFNNSKSKSRRGSSISTGRRISILKFESLNYEQPVSRRFSEPTSVDIANCLVQVTKKKTASFRAENTNAKNNKNYKNCIIS